MAWPWIAGAFAAVVVLGAFLGLALTSFKRRPARILVVVPQHYWHPDVAELLAALPASRAEPVIASIGRGPLTPEGPPAAAHKAALAFSDAKPEDYAAVVFTGGSDLRFASDQSMRQEAKAFCGAMLRAGKPVAGLCGGPAVLAKAGLLEGKRATGHKQAHSLMNEGKALIRHEDVIEDGGILTARDSGAARKLATALLERLNR